MPKWKIGDCVRPKPEWKGNPNQIPTGTVRKIEIWGSEGALYVGDERRTFAAYVFEPNGDLQMKFDEQDKRALRALDDTFTIDGETATITGEMEVVITRLDADRFLLKLKFSGEELDVKIARAQLLQELNINADDS